MNPHISSNTFVNYLHSMDVRLRFHLSLLDDKPPLQLLRSLDKVLPN